MLPNFIGIGAPKAGTTWLFKCLQEHPQVFIAAAKETKFFDEESIEGRLSSYEAHFENSEPFDAVGEISTRYLASEKAPQRIRELLPNIRLFVSLRNPVEQVYSHYWHLRRQNFHQWDHKKIPRSFEEAINLYEDKLLSPAFYYRHLERWLQHFDRSQLLVIIFDDIRSHPQKVINSLYSFLDVDSTFEPEALERNGSSVRRGGAPRYPSLGEIHSFVYRNLNRSIYYPLKRIVGSWTADRVKESLKIRQIMELLFLRKGYPEMQLSTRELLRLRFAEEIQQVSELAGRDLLRRWK